MAGNMAGSRKLELTSYQTALCIIPSTDQCWEFDRLRRVYDKAYGRWPPHINVLYPFVSLEDLPRAKELLEAGISSRDQPIGVRLNDAGCFSHRNNNTIFASADAESNKKLESIRNEALEALGQPKSGCNFHLTIGQSVDGSAPARDYLLTKAKLLPPADLRVAALAILVREHSSEPNKTDSCMRLYGTVELAQPSAPIAEFWLQSRSGESSEAEDEDSNTDKGDTVKASKPSFETTYCFESGTWKACAESKLIPNTTTVARELSISTYNVLADSNFPPSTQRDPDLLRTILSKTAKADILVLQEITDSFLTYMLTDDSVQQHYTYTSHGPSCQAEIGPLPSLRNVVILSRWPFTWTFLPFHRRHKGAVIVRMEDVGTMKDSVFQPLVVAGIHLTSGLTDGSIAAKRVQIAHLLKHLKREHPLSQWIVAGDFNLTTSAMTIDIAIRDGSISDHTARVLSAIETDMVQAGLIDAWTLARVDATDESAFAGKPLDLDDVFEGEEGATFDPRENALAEESSGTSKNRPQRYDRILVKSQGILSVASFNLFGQSGESTSDAAPVAWPVPSDHYGIRASFLNSGDNGIPTQSAKPLQAPPLHIKTLHGDLSSGPSLVSALAQHRMFPSEDESSQRREAFSTLKTILVGAGEGGEAISHLRLEIAIVGSYALGVWTSSSDIDCLCIGNISSKTFFKLARQRLRGSVAEGVRILRKVEANSGTMLELLVKGVYMDLQYCPATKVVEQWSAIPDMPSSDPIFDLSLLSLRKLKPYRDLTYIKKTLPDTAAFRLAYRCVKFWAVQNGLYSSKFGYLGGIHITLMLAIVCKRMAHQVGQVTAEGLIGTFFQHYADFDWTNEMLYDPFFHKTRPRYHRTAREPMVILGYHAPNANVAHTSTIPGMEVLGKEFKRANARLSDPSTTWQTFFEDDSAATRGYRHFFLRAYDDYVRVDVQFWGRSMKEGKNLVGWLESRCLIVVVEIRKALPGVEVRIWPARFASSDARNEQDYQGCYLIGLSRNSSTEVAETKLQRQSAKDQLISIIKRFEDQLRSDEKYYDVSKSWIGVNLVKSGDLKELHLDERTWGEHEAEDEHDSADDEPELEEDGAEGVVTRTLPVLAASTKHRPSGSGKLRPASDVLNRLRWDPNLVLSDYIIGYEDRFLGAKETTLEKWKTEKTDEEFIPQHRILYFRRKGDGVVVWDRKARVDTIFGSGTS